MGKFMQSLYSIVQGGYCNQRDFEAIFMKTVKKHLLIKYIAEDPTIVKKKIQLLHITTA